MWGDAEVTCSVNIECLLAKGTVLQSVEEYYNESKIIYSLKSYRGLAGISKRNNHKIN